MKLTISKTKQREDWAMRAGWVLKEIERVAPLMGFDKSWRIKITFKKLHEDTLAENQTEWHYRLVKLSFDLEKLDDEELAKCTARHEMLHIPCWRIVELFQALAPQHVELATKYEEELVTFFEHMPIWNNDNNS